MRKRTKIYQLFGPMYGVLYPYRKTPDLYVALDGKPILCASCGAKFEFADFDAHIQSHDKRNKRANKALKDRPDEQAV